MRFKVLILILFLALSCAGEQDNPWGNNTPDAGYEISASEDTDTKDVDHTTDTKPNPSDIKAPEDSGKPIITGALVINEIMFNPKASSDDTGEWIEIYNGTSTDVDLKGWTIKDKFSNTHTIGTTVEIKSSGYAVLGRSDDPTNNGGYTANYVYDNFKLTNTGDTVILVDPSGTTIDEVSYKVDGVWPASQSGTSIELKSPELDNLLGASWALAVATFGDGDKGTPGGPNGEAEPAYSVDTTVTDWQSSELKATLHFSPNDGMEAHVLKTIAAAKSHVRLAFFNIRLPGIKNTLVQLIQKGVDVEVILDADQQAQEYNTMGEDMIAANIPMILVENKKAKDSTMHNKFTVIDKTLVMTGSANYSSTALNKSDEDLLTLENTDIAQRYLAEYLELVEEEYQKSPPYDDATKVKAWMGPEDNLDKKLVALIDNAQKTVLVAQFQFNHTGLGKALIEAKNRGVTVVVILDTKQSAEEVADESLIDAGISVIYAENKKGNYTEMHSKFMVVDHAVTAVGSFNWSSLAAYHNDENIVIIEDAGMAARAEGKIANLIDTYDGGKAAALGLTTGKQKVTFSVKNLTLDDGATLSLKSIGGPFTEGVAFTGTTATVDVEAGTRIEYRYSVTGDAGTMNENGANHHFTVPYSPGPFTVSDIFRP